MAKKEDPRTVAARKKFKEEVSKLYPDKEYEFLEEFRKSTVPIKARHNVCGHTWLISPVNFYHGRRCPVCRGGGGVHGSSQDIFEKRVAARIGGDYTVVGKYAGTHTPIGIKHNVCGRITNVSPTNFLKKLQLHDAYTASERKRSLKAREPFKSGSTKTKSSTPTSGERPS